MKVLTRLLVFAILFNGFRPINCFSQKEKLSGHWKIIKMVSDEYPAGLDQAMVEDLMFKELKKKTDSAGLNINADDSINIKRSAKETYDEVFNGLYIQFNPDETCAWNFGSIEKGTLIKGKYKIKESVMTVTILMNKEQNFLDKDLKAKERKMIFFYYFKEGLLRLDSDDGSLRFQLVKD